MSKKIIILGICARNEELTIYNTLDSVFNSLILLKDVYEYKLVVCLNGCTDNTKIVTQSWIQQHKTIDSSIELLEYSNLIDAQRKIVDSTKEFNPHAYIFVDADVIIDKFCFKFLLQELEKTETQAAYAVSIPIKSDSSTLISNVMNLYDTSPTVFTPRYHLHGRVFAIKQWNIPKTDPALLVDDIYLSLYLLKNFGLKSIRKVDQAIVYFRQIKYLRDYYNIYRRRQIELRKCAILFPDLFKIPEDQINRRIIWKNFFKENFKNKRLWITLIIMKILSKIIFKINNFLYPVNRPQWKPTLSSKASRDIPILILLEGLDCSGKKTIARALVERLHFKGIGAIIHSGPLSYNFYNKISQFISLHRCPDSIRSFVYSFEGLGDKKCRNKFHTDIIIQISSPFRIWAYANTKILKIRCLINKLLVRQFAQYDLIFYLSTQYEIRLERHKSQIAAGENPEKIDDRFISKNFFEKMDENLIKLLKNNQKIDQVFDTSTEKIQNITDEILVHINKLI